MTDAAGDTKRLLLQAAQVGHVAEERRRVESRRTHAVAAHAEQRRHQFGADRYDPKDLTLSLSYDLQKAAIAALGNSGSTGAVMGATWSPSPLPVVGAFICSGAG